VAAPHLIDDDLAQTKTRSLVRPEVQLEAVGVDHGIIVHSRAIDRNTLTLQWFSRMGHFLRSLSSALSSVVIDVFVVADEIMGDELHFHRTRCPGGNQSMERFPRSRP